MIFGVLDRRFGALHEMRAEKKTLIPVLLPVPLPVSVPIQNLPQSQETELFTRLKRM